MIERKHIEAIEAAHNNLLAMLKGEYSVSPDDDHNWLILPDAIASALAACDESQSHWRSMESAPCQDEDRAIVYDRALGVIVAEIDSRGNWWPIENGCGCCGRHIEPLMWMPVPSAPEVEDVR